MRKNNVKQESSLYRIKQQLKVIFIFYSSFGDRDNYKLLKNQSYRRMLCDAQISQTDEDVKKYDIIYSKHNKNRSGLTFKQFIDILPQISQQMYEGEGMNAKQSLTILMKQHLFSLQQYILSKTDLGEDLNCLQQETQIKSFQLLLDIKPILYRIYKRYWPPDSKPTFDKCFTNLQNFMREFELSPQLTNKSIAHIIFQEIIDKQSEHIILDKFTDGVNDNKLFSFKKFIELLVDLALVGGRKQGIQGQSQTKKIINILQRMQLSNGFKIIQKLIQPSQIKATLLIKDHKQIYTPLKSKNTSNFQSQYQSHKKSNKSVDIQNYFSIQSQSKNRSPTNPGNLQIINKSPDRRKGLSFDFTEHQYQIINKHYQQIKIRFEAFCSYGQTLNTTTLKSIKLSKILKEIGILHLIQQTRLDLIISNLLRSSPSGKIQFPQFLKVLCEISLKIEMSLEKIISTLLAYQGQNGQLARKLQDKAYILVGSQDPQVYELLDEIQKPLKIYFQFYSKNKQTMNFIQFSKFMYDFELFPFLISKPRLFQIFNQIVDKTNRGQKIIQFQMFKQALGLCSLEISDSRLRKIQKLLLLLQRMNDSNAPKQVLKSLGITRNTYGMKVDFLSQARKKYTYFYEKQIFNEKPSKKKQIQNFDSIMLDI